ncbi:thiamine phosphate synthase [Bacillus sp. HMF5848]|uniref:thiamine phosphate synthase n=1 Tax=Bacillus sp. HMF5848 TaxID=2495421 RepID=UPI000F779538|nr:thiamine phosphate synthase [Bacillus sp. HMF5848]RSK26406.1 thiamine phosphate synthase [Bacillus sp. HMF5848]
MNRDALQVYFIMGSPNCRVDPATVLQEAIAGGITMFQFREKGQGALHGPKKLALARELQAKCKHHGIPFIVNDDIDLAVKLNADGVHIGQEDESCESVRKRLGPDKIIGVSAHSLQEAKLAIEQGADYLGIGPIFPTSTKEDAKAASGVTLIKEIREAGLTIPIVGIGGINANNAREVIEAGADGVSVITAISEAASPRTATELLKESVTNG